MMSKFPEQNIIVMVEDDEGHATLIQKNLRRAGINNQIVVLKDGQAALDFFYANPTPDILHKKILVLLDLNLPEIDGYEVLRRLKTEASTKRIPVIVLTTTDFPREVDRCYELGCNVYITKPVEYDHFVEVIHKLGLMLAAMKTPHSS